MRKILFFILLSIFMSCNSGHRDSQLLIRADSLIEIRPDSALTLLRMIDKPPKLTRSMRALYALLLTQANDKSYILHKSDSLIRIAVNYYDKGIPNELAAKSRYYLGRVYQDIGNEIAAIDEFLHAVRLLPENAEKRFQMLLYNDLADCAESQGYYDLALKMFRKSYLVTMQLGDKKEIFYSLRGIGGIYTLQNKLESALHYYRQALSIAKETQDSIWASAILCDMARVYNERQQYEQARNFALNSLKHTPSNRDLTPCYFLLGQIFMTLNQPEQARLYLKKSYIPDDIYAKEAAFHALYRLESNEKEYDKAIAYNDTALVLYDSIQNMKHASEMNSLLYDHKLEMHKKEANDLYRRVIITIAFISITIILSTAILFLMLNEKKKRKIQKLKTLLVHNRTAISVLKKQISEKTSLEDRDIKDRLFILQKQKMDMCAHFFKLSSYYKTLIDIESTQTRNEKKQLLHIEELRKYIDEIFTEPINDLHGNCPALNSDDLYYIVLTYLKLPKAAILYCMKTVSHDAIAQRRYRVKNKLSKDLVEWLFPS